MSKSIWDMLIDGDAGTQTLMQHGGNSNLSNYVSYTSGLQICNCEKCSTIFYFLLPFRVVES